jgi:hypothetical protein
MTHMMASLCDSPDANCYPRSKMSIIQCDRNVIPLLTLSDLMQCKRVQYYAPNSECEETALLSA